MTDANKVWLALGAVATAGVIVWIARASKRVDDLPDFDLPPPDVGPRGARQRDGAPVSYRDVVYGEIGGGA